MSLEDFSTEDRALIERVKDRISRLRKLDGLNPDYVNAGGLVPLRDLAVQFEATLHAKAIVGGFEAEFIEAHERGRRVMRGEA